MFSWTLKVNLNAHRRNVYSACIMFLIIILCRSMVWWIWSKKITGSNTQRYCGGFNCSGKLSEECYLDGVDKLSKVHLKFSKKPFQWAKKLFFSTTPQFLKYWQSLIFMNTPKSPLLIDEINFSYKNLDFFYILKCCHFS